MVNHIQPRALFVDSFNNVPGRFGDVGTLEHLFLGDGVIFPLDPGFQINRRQFPLLQRIVDAHQEPQLLFFIRDRKPVFDQDDV